MIQSKEVKIMLKKAIAAVAFVLTLASMPAIPVLAVTPADATTISRVTGRTPAGETMPNPNQTPVHYSVWGTDLGIMWDAGNGTIMMAFGDTDGSAAKPDWRSNTLAISEDSDPSDGLSMLTMIQDPPGRAKQILPSKKINNDEQTVIPTAGVTVGSRHYIHYMSVNHWGTDANWVTNYAGIAYSDDDGRTWTKDANARWQNDAGGGNYFQQAAFAEYDGYVYMFGTENGRAGDVYLARVPENGILNKSAYQYWDGNTWQTDNAAAARPVVGGPVGEMSVAYNSHFRKWLMMYKNKDRAAIVLREADRLTGPWSGEKIVQRGAGLYGPFIHPWFNDGTDLYYNVSKWRPEYNVFFTKARLVEDSQGGNLVSDPGFEDQRSTVLTAPWQHDAERCLYCGREGEAAVESGSGSAHSGNNNAIVRGTSGTHAIKQRIAVAPHTNYTLKGWIRTSGNNRDGYFGVRGANGGSMLNETKFAALPDDTELTVTFNSGDNAIVDLFAGIAANGSEVWLRADDLSLTEGGAVNARPSWSDSKQLTADYITATGLTLNWSGATDDQAVTGYVIYKDGEPIGAVSGDMTTYVVGGLAENQTYAFKVEAKDADNLESTDGPVYVLGGNMAGDPGFEEQPSYSWTIVDDADLSPDLVYHGTWSAPKQAGAYRDTVHVTGNAGDDLEYTFRGSAIRVFTKTGPASGMMDIYLDGAKVSTFDTYSPAAAFRVPAYENTAISPYGQPHTLKVVNTGNKIPASTGNFVHADFFETKSLAPWYSEGNAGIDAGSGFAHTGSNNAWAGGSSGWNAVYQPVDVKPNTDYRLTGWVQTSYNNRDGRFGVRLPQLEGQGNGTIVSEAVYGNVPNYTKQTVTFNSGANSLVELFAGLQADGSDAWIRLDDISLNEIPPDTEEVTADFPGVRKLVEGLVSRAGVANALNAKLNAAEQAEARGNKTARDNQLDAFIRQIRAQTGQAVSPEHAEALIRCARELMK